MKFRILPRDEYSKLAQTGYPDALASTLPEASSMVLVVEEGDKIIATMGVCQIVHFEDLWVSPEANAGAKRMLLGHAAEIAKGFGAKWVWGGAQTEEMESYIRRFGGSELKLKSFVIPLEAN